MSAIRSNSEMVLVNDNGTNNVIINYRVTGLIETNHKIDVQEDYSLFNPNDCPPMPPTGDWVEAQTFYNFNGTIFNCIQSHDRTIDDPDAIPALFSQYRAQGLPWAQPLSTNPYQLNDTVTHPLGTYWKSLIYDNIFEPGVQGSENLWEETDANGDPLPTPIPVWQQPTGSENDYNIDDQVYYPTELDDIYKSLINANTTVPDGDEPFNRYWENLTNP